MKNLKRYSIIVLLLMLYILCYSFLYANFAVSDLSHHLLRLHVIANSDSEEDQNLKYKVRDALINYMNSITGNITSKEEAITLAKDHIEDFEKIANKVINENGYNYPVKLSIGNFPFPTKEYGDISLPAGFYDALKVEIGQAQGRNWWCVMFPSLCFVDISSGIVPEESKKELESNLTEEDYNLISSNTTEYNLKFKIVELFENGKIFTAKK